jgi:hypothetical protein
MYKHTFKFDILAGNSYINIEPITKKVYMLSGKVPLK